MDGLQIAFFGSSLLSAYWNGAATYYRGLIRALAARGHRVTFHEPAILQRLQHRDMDEPSWATSVVYPARDEGDVYAAVEAAGGADVVVKASGVGAFDGLLEEAVLGLRGARTAVVFLDVDAPATLARIEGDAGDPFRVLLPGYDLVVTYGGGPGVVARYRALGARACVPIYNALDPATHRPVRPDPRFSGLLAFLGNRLPDREARVREFFFEPARALRDERFLLGGSGWDGDGVPDLPNVVRLGHVPTRDHNAFNVSPRAVLNVNRASMAVAGFSPPTRIFEAAGAGACLVVDAWPGIEHFLQPGEECLLASDAGEVVEHLSSLDEERATRIGRAARRRVLAEHTYSRRARELEAALVSALQRPLREVDA